MTILPKKKVPKDKSSIEVATHEHHASHSISDHSSRSRPIHHNTQRSITPPEERHRVTRIVHNTSAVQQSVDLQDPGPMCPNFPSSVVNPSPNTIEVPLAHTRPSVSQVELKDSNASILACDASVNPERSASSKRRHGRISPHIQPYSRGKTSKVTSANLGASCSSVPLMSHALAAQQSYIDDHRPISPPASGVARGGRRRQRPRSDNKEDHPTSGHNSDDELVDTRTTQLDENVDYEEIERKFTEALKEVRGFYIKDMVEDGACLFRAVADQVYGDQNMHDEARRNCMDYMMKNADFFSNYVTEDFISYVTRKKLPHTFGNHLEMQAMAELYNRSFEVYQYTTEPINIFHATNQTDNDPIRVSYHRNSHYNSVINPYKASIGVGLGLPSFTPGLADQMLLESAQRSSEQELLEQQMLEDKLQAADWENTEDEMVREVAHESFVDYLRHQEESARIRKQLSGSEDSKGPSCSQSSLSDVLSEPHQHSQFKEDSSISNAHTSTSSPYFCNPGLGDWVEESDESAVLAQVLAQSQREYYESLTRNDCDATSSASCSKYPTDK